jgi:hypothetical protein
LEKRILKYNFSSDLGSSILKVKISMLIYLSRSTFPNQQFLEKNNMGFTNQGALKSS